MEAIKGNPISLSALVTKNAAPVSGAVVHVQVLRVSDEALLLDEDLIQTSTPGLYSFLWSEPPNQVDSLLAMYSYFGRIYIEDIVIVDSTAIINRTQELIAEIKTPDISAKLEDNSLASTSAQNVLESNISSADGVGEVSQTIGTAEVDQNIVDAETGC